MQSRHFAWISRSVRPFLSASWAPRLPSLPEDADQIRQLEHGWLGVWWMLISLRASACMPQDFQLIGNTASRMKQPAAIQGAWFLGSNTFVSA
jgi:hypothetical protein